MCAPMFIWHQSQQPQGASTSKCPSTDEWLNTTWSSHTVEYNSSFKRKEKKEKDILTHATVWKNLKDIILRKPVPKRQSFMIPQHIHRHRKQNGGCQGLEARGMGNQCFMRTDFQLGKMTRLQSWMVVMVHTNQNVLNTTELVNLRQ